MTEMRESSTNDIESTPEAPSGLNQIIAIAALVACFLVSGCGGGDSANDSSDPGDLQTSTPDPVGNVDQVVWDLPYGEPISLDFTQSYNFSENTVLANMCEALIRITPDLKFAPALAESWSRTGPTTWVYEIRDGVNFWDGAPLTARDVAASLRRHLNAADGSFYALPFGEQIESVDETGPLEVTVTTEFPTVVVHEMLATGLGTIAQAKYMEEKGDEFGTPQGGLMCTGPFEFDKWNSGRDITLVRNDDYWDPDRAAHADQFVFKFLTDSTTLTNALQTGEIDGTYEAPVDAIPQLQQSSEGQLILGTGTQNLALFPTGTEPTLDVRVRQALSLMIDRPGLAETVYSGAAAPLKGVYLLPITYAYAEEIYGQAYDELPERTQDIEAAKMLLEEAELESSTMTLGIAAGDAASLQVANTLVDGAKDIGLQLEIEQFPPADFLALFFDPEGRKQIDLMLTAGYQDIADPLQYFELAALPESLQNFIGYDNPVVNRSIKAARGTDNEGERARLVLEAVDEVERGLPQIPILHTPERLFLNNRLTGAPASFPYQYGPWAANVGASE